MRDRTPDALIVSSDARIGKVLSQPGAKVIPASAYRLDGFVNDTFTEYANPSIYRPASVCAARTVSTVRASFYSRSNFSSFTGRTAPPGPDMFADPGLYHLGFTMYTSARHDEAVDIWFGDRLVARARHPDPDNRVHLFVVPERLQFRVGESIRLVTSGTDGPCRVENLVFLPKRPRPTERRLRILSPHVDLRHADGGVRACVTWVTNRPVSGALRWGRDRTPDVVRLPDPLSNHEVVLEGLEPGKAYRYEIRMKGRTGKEAVHAGAFQTDLAPPRSRARKARLPLLLRRPLPDGSPDRRPSMSGPWPVSVGVPFPKGALGSDGEVRLVGKRNAEIPLQTRTLARWPDGSVRWALLDFEADGRSGYRVEYGGDVARAQAEDPIVVTESRTGVVVTTGPLRVEFPKGRAAFPGIVSLRQADGMYRRLSPAQLGPAVTLVAGDGTPFVSRKPDSVALEASGPERVCVRVDLRHRSRGGKALFRSVLRVHLFRGSGAVRVLHTFENDRTDAEFTQVRELRLRADLDVGAGAAGRIDRRAAGPLTGQPVRLRQTHDDRYVVSPGRGRVRGGRRAGGEVDLSGDRAGVAFSVRDFWQNYPKGVAVDAGGITFEGCPPLGREDYPRGGELEDRLYYYLLDGRYRFKRGVSRTHECWFHFRSAGAAPPEGFHACVQRPPLYSVSRETFNRSRAVTRLPSKAKSPYPSYEAWVEAAREVYARDREASRAYGMLNHGDYFGERTYNWGNMEYDTPWGFLQEYLRGGHPDFYTWAEEAARHLVDVDTCHHSPNPKAVGEQYSHCVGHVGGYYPDGHREEAIFRGSWSVTHTWVEGLFLHHLLTGEPRALVVHFRKGVAYFRQPSSRVRGQRVYPLD